MSKKSIFEKMGLVQNSESNSAELNESLCATADDVYESEIEIPENIVLKDVMNVQEIYEKFNLTDDQNTIYKIEQFSSALPKELNNDAKKASVIGILSASNLDVATLIADGDVRKQALLSTLKAFSDETTTIVESKKTEIAELELKIDQLKTEINDRKNAQEKQDNLIKDEVENIQGIIDFIK